MDTLHLNIQEALRLNPPLLMVMRYAKESFAVSTSDGRQYVVPKVRCRASWGLAGAGCVGIQVCVCAGWRPDGQGVGTCLLLVVCVLI